MEAILRTPINSSANKETDLIISRPSNLFKNKAIYSIVSIVLKIYSQKKKFVTWMIAGS